MSLPPHCSRRLQPLDVTFYSPLKGAFKAECGRYMKSERLVRITLYELVVFLTKHIHKWQLLRVAVSGFKVIGIYALNPNIFSNVDYCAADALLDGLNLSLPIIENDMEIETQRVTSETPSN